MSNNTWTWHYLPALCKYHSLLHNIPNFCFFSFKKMLLMWCCQKYIIFHLNCGNNFQSSLTHRTLLSFLSSLTSLLFFYPPSFSGTTSITLLPPSFTALCPTTTFHVLCPSHHWDTGSCSAHSTNSHLEVPAKSASYRHPHASLLPDPPTWKKRKVLEKQSPENLSSLSLAKFQ